LTRQNALSFRIQPTKFLVCKTMLN